MWKTSTVSWSSSPWNKPLNLVFLLFLLLVANAALKAQSDSLKVQDSLRVEDSLAREKFQRQRAIRKTLEEEPPSSGKQLAYDAEAMAYKAHRTSMMAAVLPGSGQIINKQYWKLPIIYGAFFSLGYFMYGNNQFYEYYRDALVDFRTNERITSNEAPPTIPLFGDVEASRLEERGLRNRREFYRRNRDLLIIVSVLTYGLSIADATVFAHLKDFEISDNLSMSINPYISPLLSQQNEFSWMTATPSTERNTMLWTFGLSVEVSLKNK